MHQAALCEHHQQPLRYLCKDISCESQLSCEHPECLALHNHKLTVAMLDLLELEQHLTAMRERNLKVA
jgi:hypothetical protein